MLPIARRLCRLVATLALCPGFVQAGDLLFTASFDEPPEGPYNDYESARFLTQATFGPTWSEIRRLRQMGYNAWLDEQLNLPFTSHRAYLEWITTLPEDPDEANYGGENDLGNDKRNMAFFERAMHAPDQLRQRMAFALSEIFVVSDQGGGLGGEPLALAHYYDLLGQGAYGNYRALLEQVTLSPVMGNYLSSLRNRRPIGNARPDENFAREILQLFSIGLVQLNTDGSVVDGDALTPDVQPVPTYDQTTVRGFAHVFTGWTYGGCTIADFRWCSPWEHPERWYLPMTAPEGVAWDPDAQATIFQYWHAYAQDKPLLDYPGVALPNGLLAGTPAPTATPHANPSPYTNLTSALDNVARHPNVGPFLSRLLIQRFVTSNPEPDYIARVAAVFNDDGSPQHVRGNLKAVMRAILMDPDARARPVAGSIQGKLREPLLRVTQLWRAFNATDPVGRYNDWYIRWPDSSVGQAPLHARTVFNFFLPDYAPTGEIANGDWVAPEFQIQTDAPITDFSNLISGLSDNSIGNPWAEAPNDHILDRSTLIDLSAERALRGNVPKLIERLDVILMSGSMSDHMRGVLTNYLGTVLDDPEDDGGYLRPWEALRVILLSPEYVIEK